MFTSPSGRLQPAWSFLLSVAFSAVALVATNYVADAIAGAHTLRLELIFRSLLALALFGLYLWLLTVADQVEEHRVAKLGFPIGPRWKRQLSGGALFGLGLTIIAVLPLRHMDQRVAERIAIQSRSASSRWRSYSF